MENNNQEFLNFVKELLKEQYSSEIIDKIIDGYNKNRSVTIRVNTIKTNVENVQKQLEENHIKYKNVAWSDTALVLKNVVEKDVQELETYKNGEIYMQSLSSMLPPIILEPQEKEDILDMAAAPGGKTTQIAALTNNNANITACEMNKIRMEKLLYNIEKQGASSVYVMPKDSRNIDDFFSFDRILLDAPCSGSGTLNLNDLNSLKYFTKKLIEKSSKTQLALLRKALKILKSGKEMVYSTCSILQCENEDIVKQILKETNCEIVPIEFTGMQELPLLPTKLEGTLCVCPDELYEGFFIAKIRKK